MNTIELIDRLEQDKSLQKEEWIHVIEDDSEENRKYAAKRHVLWVIRIMEKKYLYVV